MVSKRLMVSRQSMVFRRLMVSRQSMVSVPPQRGRIGGGWCHRTGNYSLYWCLSEKGSAISTRKSTEILIKSKENMSKIIRDDQSVMTNLWCSVLSVFYFRPASIAVGRWALYAHWYCYSVVRCGVPSLRQGHKSKKETRIARTLHGLVFHGSFFDVI